VTSGNACLTLHATAVALGNRAVLITGASGSGKSGLAIDLMSRGCALISDDRTLVMRRDGSAIASAPDALKGRIEARGIGLLACSAHPPAPIRLVVNLDTPPARRMPDPHTITLLGVEIQLINAANLPNLAAAISLILTGAIVT